MDRLKYFAVAAVICAVYVCATFGATSTYDRFIGNHAKFGNVSSATGRFADLNASGVTQDSTHRFATDAEKATWNAKQIAFANATTLQTIGRGGVGGIAVDDVVTKGPWVDNRVFGNLSSAKVYAESVGKPLHVYTPQTVNTLTFNCEVDVIRGGSITVNSGKIATFNSDFHAGTTHYCLKGSGSVTGLTKYLVTWFGADWKGLTDSADSIQKAVDSATKNCPVIYPGGRYKVVCKSTSPFTYGNDVALPLYRAVSINKSDLTMIGEDAEIYVVGYNGAGNEVNYAFASDKNMTLGTYSNLRVKGLKFDFDPTGDLGSNKRSFHIVGFRGVFLDDLFFTSTGARAGATVTLQNTETVRLSRLRFKNITQGFNFSYVSDIVGDDWQFDNFNEAVDFDRIVTGVSVKNLSFINAQNTSQCLDINSVVGGNFSGIYVSGVGNIATVNYKDTTPLTYADYVNNVTPTALTPSKGIVIEGVRGKTIGSGTNPSFILGIDRTAGFAGYGPCENIVLRDIELEDVSYISWEDVKDGVMERVRLKNVSSPNSTSYAAIAANADSSYVDSYLSLTLRDVVVDGCQYKGFRASSANKVALDNVRVKDYNSTNTASMGVAFDLTSLNGKGARIYIDRSTAEGGLNSPVGYQFGDNAAGNFELHWGTGNRALSQTVPVSFAGTAHKYVKKSIKVPLGDVAVTASKDYGVLFGSAGTSYRAAYAILTVTQTLAADGSNYPNGATKSTISGVDATVSSASMTAGITKSTAFDLGMAVNESAATLSPGDGFFATLSPTGTGATLKGALIEVFYCDFSTF